MSSVKDFGPIESDYNFFMNHSTEAENDVRDYVAEAKSFAKSKPSLRMLDFGCGSGQFSQQFLNAFSYPANQLHLSLLEPVTSQRAQAADKLKNYSQHPIIPLDDVAQSQEPFDLILANHVLYYVDDIKGAVDGLISQLAPQGLFLTAMAGWDNKLIQLWKRGFESINEPVPFPVAEDLQTILDAGDQHYQRTQSNYVLTFSDTRENRLKILRFLFERHLDKISIDSLLAEFDAYTSQATITIDTFSYHFQIHAP